MLPRDMQERRLTQAAAKGDAGSSKRRCSTLQMPTQAAAFLYVDFVFLFFFVFACFCLLGTFFFLHLFSL
jgi:hypothetical protein